MTYNDDSDRPPSSDDEESDEEDDQTKKLKLATTEMKSTFFNAAAKSPDVDDFISRHREVVLHGGQDGTILHAIVKLVYESSDNKLFSFSKIQPLVKKLLYQHPDLLSIQNNEGQNPLYRAIFLKKNTRRLVDYMLDACPNQHCIDEVLEAPCGKGESIKTCLTLAFEKDIRPRVLQNLIKHASEKALGLKDGTQKTPLHYAVRYSQCSDERVDILKLFLEKDSQAVEQLKAQSLFQPINTFLDCTYVRKDDRIEYSVYTEHKRTARAYQDSQRARADRESKPSPEAEQEPGDMRAQNSNLVIRETEQSKATHREMGPKGRGTKERDSKRTDRILDRRKPELEKPDETERRRQQLREAERNARAGIGQPRDKALGAGDHSWTRPGRDFREQLEDADLNDLKIVINSYGTGHAPNTPIKRSSTQRLFVEEKKVPVKSSSTKLDAHTLAENSTRILNMMKLHYMRTRSIQMATSFLYGRNNPEDKQICFDYGGLPSEIQDTIFTERFGKDSKSGIRFDEILMYVRFPIVKVERTGRNASPTRTSGRQDMRFFFSWLYKKGVRRILKVEVEDSDKIPHSDESIHIALGKIIVEHLDWQKTDLDPQVILSVGCQAEDSEASKVDDAGGARNKMREVTLKWSGNNAVLRAWSEPEGLPQLPELEVVNLRVPVQADLCDTKDWVKANLEEFRVRLNKNANAKLTVNASAVRRPSKTDGSSEHRTEENAPLSQERKIIVRTTEGKKGIDAGVSSGGGTKPMGKLTRATEHEWLTCMERFAGNMDILWTKTIELLTYEPEKLSQLSKTDKKDLTNLRKDVVVALIDDGVDSCDPAFSGRSIEGTTFDFRDEGNIGQYYISARGHGTEMAKMILKVCPMASIYSIRLKTQINQVNGRSSIDAASAALAIEAALDKNATIISMSWTIPEPQEGSDEKKLLDAVLERACSKKVPMFCSSSDQISATKHYPSAYKRASFFVIGAAHDDGTNYGHAGKNNDFIFPGVNVNTSSGSSLPVYLADKTSSTKESTGSSIATALAAGLAALIIYCFKASALALLKVRIEKGKGDVPGTELVKPADVDRIAEHETLARAFDKIGKQEKGQFIPVWDRFSPANQELEAELKSHDEKLTYIMKLCSNLIER